MAAALPFATSPDPTRYPVHRLGTWEHALLCMAADVPTPQESAAALARWDRKASVGRQGRLARQASRASDLRLMASEVVRTAGGVMPVEMAARRTARGRPGVDAAAVEDAILGQVPVDLTGTEERQGTQGARRFTTAAGEHLAVTSVPRLRQSLGLPARPVRTAAPVLEVVPDVPEPVENIQDVPPGPDVEDVPPDPVEDVPLESVVPVEVLRDPAPGFHRMTRRVVCESRRRMIDEAAEIEELAAEYNVEDEALADAVAGRTWDHIRLPPPVVEDHRNTA